MQSPRLTLSLSGNYMHDTMRTDALVRFSPESIACACIWLAARKVSIPLPEAPAWWVGGVIKIRFSSAGNSSGSLEWVTSLHSFESLNYGSIIMLLSIT